MVLVGRQVQEAHLGDQRALSVHSERGAGVRVHRARPGRSVTDVRPIAATIREPQQARPTNVQQGTPASTACRGQATASTNESVSAGLAGLTTGPGRR